MSNHLLEVATSKQSCWSELIEIILRAKAYFFQIMYKYKVRTLFKIKKDKNLMIIFYRTLLFVPPKGKFLSVGSLWSLFLDLLGNKIIYDSYWCDLYDHSSLNLDDRDFFRFLDFAFWHATMLSLGATLAL